MVIPLPVILVELISQVTDAAIRGAHRFQLDLGYNQLKELSDEEYQEWRQLWLTIISFDRYVDIRYALICAMFVALFGHELI